MEGITRTHNIYVNAEQSAKGKRKQPNKCPLALALIANFEPDHVMVTAFGGQWYDRETGTLTIHGFACDRETRDTVARFDNGGNFPPGWYHIIERRN